MRTVLYVPLIHTPEESGGGDPRFRQAMAERLGPERLAGLESAAQDLWHESLIGIIRWFALESVTGRLVHVYLDGLADRRDATGRRGLYEPTPADEMTNPTRHLAWVLFRNGARIHGPEDPELMRECSERMDAEGFAWRRDSSDSRGPWLMNARDPYIARTVHETLPDGHWGILLIGSAHRADEELRKVDPSIRIIYVVDNPVTGQSATPLP